MDVSKLTFGLSLESREWSSIQRMQMAAETFPALRSDVSRMIDRFVDRFGIDAYAKRLGV